MCRLWQPTGGHPKSFGLVLGRRLSGAILHSSNELDELLQWLFHDVVVVVSGMQLTIA